MWSTRQRCPSEAACPCVGLACPQAATGAIAAQAAFEGLLSPWPATQAQRPARGVLAPARPPEGTVFAKQTVLCNGLGCFVL